jgi:hypothetical protein
MVGVDDGTGRRDPSDKILNIIIGLVGWIYNTNIYQLNPIGETFEMALLMVIYEA